MTNVIYRYVNLTRLADNDPPFYYIGSKVECSIYKPYEDDDILYLYDNKSDRCYFGSPSRTSYWDHWKTDKFTVEVLENVPDRKFAREKEGEWLVKVDAASNVEYYNMTNVTLTAKGGCIDKHAIVNIYGEEYATYAQRMSNRSKRDTRAISLGFRNFGELTLFIKEKLDEGFSHPEISKGLLKVSSRAFSRVTVKDYDLDKMVYEIEMYKDRFDIVDEIRGYITLGATINKISEMVNLEIPTVRYLIGEYWFGESGSRRSSKLFNKTQLEMELDITSRWVNDESILSIQKSYDKVSPTTIRRYLDDCLKRNLKGKELI